MSYTEEQMAASRRNLACIDCKAQPRPMCHLNGFRNESNTLRVDYYKCHKCYIPPYREPSMADSIIDGLL